MLQAFPEQQVVLVEQASKLVEELGAAYLVPEAYSVETVVGRGDFQL